MQLAILVLTLPVILAWEHLLIQIVDNINITSNKLLPVIQALR